MTAPGGSSTGGSCVRGSGTRGSAPFRSTPGRSSPDRSALKRWGVVLRSLRHQLPVLGALPWLWLPFLLLLPGCRGNGPSMASDLEVELGISPTPPVVGPARLIVTLADTMGNPIDGAEVRVEGNMSHAGMTPVMDTAVARGDGLYVVPEFGFTMGGDWVLTVMATLPDGRTATVRKPTSVGGGAGGKPH